MAVQPTLQCPEKVSVKQGEQAIISCNVTGDPKPNITWTKDSQVISRNSTLVIYNVGISDGGTCNVTANNGRSVAVLVELDILCKFVSFYNALTKTSVSNIIMDGLSVNYYKH